jgi:hypothetical protein
MGREKSSSKKKTEQTPESILRGEIAEVCGLLDEEALIFLKRQADVLLHNSRVEKMRQKASAEAHAGEAENPPPAGTRPAPQTVDRSVKIERTGGETFNIYVGKKRVFFNRAELRSLTKICHAAGNDAEGGRRLFAWFQKERGDFLIDTEIESPSALELAQLCGLIVNTYKVKE